MTLLDLLRLHGKVELSLPDARGGAALVRAGTASLTLEIEDVKFAAGGALTMVHEVPSASVGAAWAGAPETCEACQ